MRKFRFKRFGPFSYFKVNKKPKHFITAWLTGHENVRFGWEWGNDEVQRNPSYCFRIGHFNLFSYERLNSGYMVFVFGFWWMR